MRSRPELLFLSGGLRGLPHRRIPSRGRILKIRFFLLHHRISDLGGCALGPIRLRIPVPLRLAAGSAAQDPRPEDFHRETEVPDLYEICGADRNGDSASGADDQRCGNGRSLFLQVYLSARRAGRSSPPCGGKCRNPQRFGNSFYPKANHPDGGRNIERGVLPAILQVGVSAGRLLRTDEQGGPVGR